MAFKSCQSRSFMKVFQRMDPLITQELRLSQETISGPPSCVESLIVIIHWCSLPPKCSSHSTRKEPSTATKQWHDPSCRCPLLFEQNPTSPRVRAMSTMKRKQRAQQVVLWFRGTSGVPVDLQKTNDQTLRGIDVTNTSLRGTRNVSRWHRPDYNFKKSSPRFVLRSQHRCVRPLSCRPNTLLSLKSEIRLRQG